MTKGSSHSHQKVRFVKECKSRNTSKEGAILVAQEGHMPLPCPQCSQVNFDQATSCIQCGFQLPATDRAKRSFSRLPAINKVSSPDLSSLTPVPFPPQSQGESLP